MSIVRCYASPAPMAITENIADISRALDSRVFFPSNLNNGGNKLSHPAGKSGTELPARSVFVPAESKIYQSQRRQMLG